MEKIKFNIMPESMTVSELKNKLEEFEELGFGAAQIYGGVPTSFDFGVTQARALESVTINTLYGSPIAYIKIK